jgi:CheY-like chemotaxis protein
MILFVDDEERRIESYVEELRALGLIVEYVSNADAAWDYFHVNHCDMDMVILDVMMPAGEQSENFDTDSGLRTGSRLYSRIRQIAPDLPVVFLSNMSEDEAGLPHDSARYYIAKRRCLPHEFADAVMRLLGKPEQ